MTIGRKGAEAGSRRWFPSGLASKDGGEGTQRKAQIGEPDHLTADLWPMVRTYLVLASKAADLNDEEKYISFVLFLPE